MTKQNKGEGDSSPSKRTKSGVWGYQRLVSDLKLAGTASLRLKGNSMEPVIPDGSVGIFEARDKYEIGDIIFCKVKKTFMVHRIIAKNILTGYKIANQSGYVNGWTRKVYGKLIGIKEPKK